MDSSKNSEIDLNSITITLSDSTMYDDGVSFNGAGAMPTISISPDTTGIGTYTNIPWTFSDNETSITQSNSGKLTLNGEGADIEVNGRSLMQILDGIEQRLGLLKTHESMEAEWEELKSIGDQYRSKLAEIENKVKVWNTLKKMPSPDIS